MYYPLDAIDKMTNVESSQLILDKMIEQNLCDNNSDLNDLFEYTFGPTFFMQNYNGKFKKWNDTIRNDRELNKNLFPMYKLSDYEGRSTEWKDVIAISQILELWSKSKMVYKIDNDFFHELKMTESILTSQETFENLPFKCFYIDLEDVKNISDFHGAWVYIHKCEENMYGVNIYMVSGENFTYFSYYAWYKFGENNKEVEWKPDDLPKSEFTARTFGTTSDNVIRSVVKSKYDLDVDESNSDFIDVYVKRSDYDPREDIIVTIFQIMSFISIDASDVSENENVKKSYKPSGNKIKNKFSEIRMWDVGIRYGKAIRIAKKEYKKHLRKERINQDNKDLKERKPVRPHIRRSHWHRYYVGKGRKDVKTLWLAPVYVCGNGKEIPVTIREIKK